MPVQFTCPVCGRVRLLNESRARRTKTCSRACDVTLRRKPLADRLWAKVAKSPDPDGCWEWTGYRLRTGYGWINTGNGSRSTHRVAWELTNGPVPDGLLVCHTCDNRVCVRPDHLFLGTDADNSDDKIAKRRNAFGSRHPLAKITEDDVREIRQLVADGMKHHEIAARFGICASNVCVIAKRRQWKHVE